MRQVFRKCKNKQFMWFQYSFAYNYRILYVHLILYTPHFLKRSVSFFAFYIANGWVRNMSSFYLHFRKNPKNLLWYCFRIRLCCVICISWNTAVIGNNWFISALSVFLKISRLMRDKEKPLLTAILLIVWNSAIYLLQIEVMR